MIPNSLTAYDKLRMLVYNSDNTKYMSRDAVVVLLSVARYVEDKSYWLGSRHSLTHTPQSSPGSTVAFIWRQLGVNIRNTEDFLLWSRNTYHELINNSQRANDEPDLAAEIIFSIRHHVRHKDKADHGHAVAQWWMFKYGEDPETAEDWLNDHC